MAKFIARGGPEGIYRALHDAGVFKDDPDMVRRVIVDLPAGGVATVYVELFADSSLTEVLVAGGAEIFQIAESEGEGPVAVRDLVTDEELAEKVTWPSPREESSGDLV